jgi:DHA1 family bicyclomycin/chloramphenicol resistance-like MFS transporter
MTPIRPARSHAAAGALQFAVGFAAGAVMSACHDGTPRPMLIVLAVLCLTALALMSTLLKPSRELIEVEV